VQVGRYGVHKTMITLTREEAQQVLDAFVNWDARGRLRLIELLRARLSAPEPEPVAWHEPGAYGNVTVHEKWANENGWLPLYTAPLQEPQIKQRTGDCLLTGVCAAEGHRIQKPRREWQGLTDEEILEEYRQSYGDDGNLTDVYFARAIEAKLKEKNN
jgi:hypothetical protein